jgi:hypothetical protein
MARRGRPRNPAAKRRQTTLAGRAPDHDHGTLQQQLRRAEMVGARAIRVEDGRVLADRNADLSHSRLGILLAGGAITHRQFEAGERYQHLAWAAYGRPFARGLDIARPRDGAPSAASAEVPDGDDGRRTGARRMLARVDAYLLARDKDAAESVKRACQFDRETEVAALRLGLTALAAWWGL